LENLSNYLNLAVSQQFSIYWQLNLTSEVDFIIAQLRLKLCFMLLYCHYRQQLALMTLTVA